MFIEALLTMVKMWKQPKCPLTDDWIKRWHTHTYTHTHTHSHTHTHTLTHTHTGILLNPKKE